MHVKQSTCHWENLVIASFCLASVPLFGVSGRAFQRRDGCGSSGVGLSFTFCANWIGCRFPGVICCRMLQLFSLSNLRYPAKGTMPVCLFSQNGGWFINVFFSFQIETSCWIFLIGVPTSSMCYFVKYNL